MNPQVNQPVRKLPFALVAVASAVIGFHLFAVGIVVLAAHSGPWTVLFVPMPTPGEPPHFAGVISNVTTRFYLQPLGLANDLHYDSNRTMISSVQFEAHLFDENGSEKTIEFPDAKANGWVRYRQTQLAQNLGGDFQLAPRRPGETIPSDPKKARKITFFEPVALGSTTMELCETYDFLQPKDMRNRPIRSGR